ncbi:hypothetical protein AMR72_16325 [Flavobacterium psychrophilum]|nr:hypothetical protein AMR72_16325 [Flavobacterium psychrophilum]AOE53931.1 hypothetical protein ALW18_16315 [Flavobacterium psychrophilum]
MPLTKTIEITAANSIELNAKAKIIVQCANLPMDDLERVGQLVGSTKALKSLKDKWLFLKAMFT